MQLETILEKLSLILVQNGGVNNSKEALNSSTDAAGDSSKEAPI